MALTKIGKEGITGISNSSDANAITITSAEEIGIGTSSPTSSSGGKLLAIETTADEHTNLVFNTANTDKNGIIEARRTGRSSAERFAQLNLQNNSDGGEMRFYTAPSGSDISERMLIGSNGHQYATNADTSLANLTLRKSAGDTIDYLQCRKTDNDLRIVLEGSGDVHNATGTFSAISDEKLKENIADASSQWDDIKNIRIRKFSLKSDNSSEANMIGVIAQELENVSPNLVKERIDRDPDTGEDLGTTTKIVKYSILHTKAVKALQEAMTRIEALETANTALEARITALENS